VIAGRPSLRACAPFALLVSFVVAAGCDATVVSVGSWTPDGSLIGTFVEAESGVLSTGFVVLDDPAASGGHYIETQAGASSEDSPGSSRATYELTVGATGTYFIWGRIRSPSVDVNRVWIQVDGGTWFKWRITVGDIWYWDRFHDNVDYGTPLTFALSAGTHTLTLANCVDGVDLDRFYYTMGQETPPGNSTLCDPPNSIEVGGKCFLSCGSQGGNACGTTDCSGRTPLPAYDCDVCCVGP
jgi:hypothetical protein